jgi:hypothetical protein
LRSQRGKGEDPDGYLFFDCFSRIVDGEFRGPTEECLARQNKALREALRQIREHAVVGLADLVDHASTVAGKELVQIHVAALAALGDKP